MRLYELTLFVTNHAYAQYCNRVEDVTRSEMEDRIEKQIQSRDYHKEGIYIHIAGVWYVAECTLTELRLVTCYGRMNFDIPKAIAWASINKDRIVLPNAD